jgi:hypothetical protein
MESTLFLDQKYIGLISPYLERFHKQDDSLYNFRCPICGDSSKNKYKARGYFYRHEGSMLMKCHNCNESMPFGVFLKKFEPTLYREYSRDKFLESGGKVRRAEDYYTDDDKEEIKPEPAPVPTNALNIPCINELPFDHYAAKYVRERQIPKEKWYRLFYTPVFCQMIAEVIPLYYQIERHKAQLKWKEPRLVMPYYDRDKKLLGMQGRAFDDNSHKRYIVAKVTEDSPKIYGLDEIDPSQTVYVLEGPIDSLFLPNALATMDGSLHTIDPLLGGLKLINRVLLPDNQPYNSGVCRSIRSAIDSGEAVVLWPSDIEQKDINAMVTDGGLSVYEILKIIEKRTFRGLSAKFEFGRWQKINR